MLEGANMEEANATGDDEFVHACFRPLLAAYKEVSAANGDVSQFVGRLTSGQQALFITYSYYVHVIESEPEFYWWSAFFMAQNRWKLLRAKTDELRASAFSELLSEIEDELVHRGHPFPLAEAHRIQRGDLERDAGLRNFFVDAYERLTSAAAAELIAQLAEAIRRSPESFRARLS